MRIVKCERSERDIARLMEIWESAVRATHRFLGESDVVGLRPLVKDALLKIAHLYYAKDDGGEITGFVGVEDGKIEMLFVDGEARGSGVGKALLLYAMDKLQADKLDVNEQNPQAVGFYEHMGFAVTGRSAVDGQGNPFPLLHMQLKK